MPYTAGAAIAAQLFLANKQQKASKDQMNEAKKLQAEQQAAQASALQEEKDRIEKEKQMEAETLMNRQNIAAQKKKQQMAFGRMGTILSGYGGIGGSSGGTKTALGQ